MNILLVEDDVSIQTIANMSLTRVGKHSVTVANNGLEALATLKAGASIPPAFDLILLDVMMPELDGFETIKRLKADPVLAALPVIFLTAKAQIAEVQHGMDLGAIGYILKPFDPMTLNDQIREVMSDTTKL